MIVGKRIKTAFAVNSHGKLSPIGENIFQFEKRKRKRKSGPKKNVPTKGELLSERGNSRSI